MSAEVVFSTEPSDPTRYDVDGLLNLLSTASSALRSSSLELSRQNYRNTTMIVMGGIGAYLSAFVFPSGGGWLNSSSRIDGFADSIWFFVLRVFSVSAILAFAASSLLFFVRSRNALEFQMIEAFHRVRTITRHISPLSEHLRFEKTVMLRIDLGLADAETAMRLARSVAVQGAVPFFPSIGKNRLVSELDYETPQQRND